jgi:hypothetical protein
MMAFKLDRDIRRVTVIKAGESGGGARTVYRNHDDDDDNRNPIKRVTVLKRDDSGRIVSREAFEGDRRGKRTTRNLRPMERGIRKLVDFQTRVLDEYMARHERSNEKKRDGWLKDMPKNVFRAVKKAKPKKLFRVSSSYRD